MWGCDGPTAPDKYSGERLIYDLGGEECERCPLALMRNAMAQAAMYLFSWAQKGQSPNGCLKDESALYHQHMNHLMGLKGEAEAKMFEDAKSNAED